MKTIYFDKPFNFALILLAITTLLMACGGKVTQENFIISAVGFFISFVVAYFSIDLLLKWLKSHTMTPFVIYRIIFGSVLLYITL